MTSSAPWGEPQLDPNLLDSPSPNPPHPWIEEVVTTLRERYPGLSRPYLNNVVWKAFKERLESEAHGLLLTRQQQARYPSLKPGQRSL